MKVAQAIADLSEYLSDQELDYEYSHWTESELMKYTVLALGIVVSHNKWLFTKRTRVMLRPGDMNEIPPPCEGLADRTVTDATGWLIRPRTEPHYPVDYPVRCISNTSNRPYAPRSVYINPDYPNQIQIDPPVPAGTEYPVYVNCFIPPKITGMDSDIDLPVGLWPAVFEFMLYYAWGVDIESAPSKERSEYHYKHGFEIMALQKNLIGA